MRRTQSLPVYFPVVRINSMAGSQSTLWSSPAVLYSALVLVLWFFGDAVLGVSLHLLHIVIEILELGLEHLLEKLFHLQGHAAQMWTAWIGFTLILLLCMFSYWHACNVLTAKFQSWDQFRRSARRWAREHWEQWSLPSLTLLLSVVWF